MIRLTKHAQEAIEQRSIQLRGWSRLSYLQTGHHPIPGIPIARFFKGIPEFGGRILRVVSREDGPDVIVITVHFDRGARR